MGYGAPKPGGEMFRRLDLFKILVALKEHILDDLLCDRGVAQGIEGDPAEHGLVSTHMRLDHHSLVLGAERFCLRKTSGGQFPKVTVMVVVTAVGWPFRRYGR